MRYAIRWFKYKLKPPKNGGAGGHVACKHHDILPQTHAERPHWHFIINLSRIQTTLKYWLHATFDIHITDNRIRHTVNNKDFEKDITLDITIQTWHTTR